MDQDDAVWARERSSFFKLPDPRTLDRRSGAPNRKIDDNLVTVNLLTPELVRDLVSLIQEAEADDAVQVLVFTSADPDYFISHVDVTRINEYRAEASKLPGEPSLALLFHYLSESRLVAIAQVEGRVRGVGSEFVLATDMRFAARESAIFSQFEPAFGVLPGGGATQHLVRPITPARQSGHSPRFRPRTWPPRAATSRNAASSSRSWARAIPSGPTERGIADRGDVLIAWFRDPDRQVISVFRVR